MPDEWLKVHDEGRWTLAIVVQPGAKKSAVVGLHGDRLKIKIAAQALEGAANAALVSFLAEQLKIKTQQITILSGLSARQKVVELRLAGPAEQQQAQLFFRALTKPHLP